jgi:hypothetical protein
MPIANFGTQSDDSKICVVMVGLPATQIAHGFDKSVSHVDSGMAGSLTFAGDETLASGRIRHSCNLRFLFHLSTNKNANR